MDEDAPHQMRWRLLAWGVAALVLLPVLYVAASGPISWWQENHFHEAGWQTAYWQSLEPLHRSTQIATPLGVYSGWWRGRPAPRAWERAVYVDQIKALTKTIAALEILEREENDYTPADAMAKRAESLGASANIWALVAPAKGTHPITRAEVAGMRRACEFLLMGSQENLHRLDVK
jgi:hypothetical protein